jgi:hypothetical protein
MIFRHMGGSMPSSVIAMTDHGMPHDLRPRAVPRGFLDGVMGAPCGYIMNFKHCTRLYTKESHNARLPCPQKFRHKVPRPP